MLVAKPSVESREQREVRKISLSERMYRETQRKISSLINDGKIADAMKLSIKYKIPMSKQSILAEMKRRNLTSLERALMNKADSMKLFQEYLEK